MDEKSAEAEVTRSNLKKQATKSKNEVADVKPDIKGISVKDVSVMITGLSKDEILPEKKTK